MKLFSKFYPLYLFFILFTSVTILSCGEEPMIEEEEEETPAFAVDIGNSTIPYLVISTNNLEIKNEPKIPATLKIYESSQLVHDLNIGIEYRGSTSFRLSDKKSFGIETWDENGMDIDVSILGLPEEEDWILNGHVVNLDGQFIYDKTMLYNHFGYTLSNQIGTYASRTKLVEIELNGIYQGVYVFMEKLKRDNNRIDIANLRREENDPENITGGYILKIDKTAGGDLGLVQPLEYFETNWADDARYTENIGFRSNYDIYGLPMQFEPYGEPYHNLMYLETYFLYEYPDHETISDQQKTYIQTYIDEFESALLTDDFSSNTRTYTDYIDIESFVDYFLLNEICRNIDGYRLSTYLQKDKGGKLNMGPIWDLNIGFDTNDRVPRDDWVINYNNHVQQDAWMMPFWWPRLMEDSLFKTAVKNRWQSLRSGPMSTANLHAIVDTGANLLKQNGAIERNYTLWDIGIPLDYDGTIQSLKDYLTERSQWMDSEIASF